MSVLQIPHKILKCKKCLARQRLMKYIKINKVNKVLSNKLIATYYSNATKQKWLKESVSGAGLTIG